MKTNTTMIRLGGLVSMSLAGAIAIGSGGATAYAGPPPSLPDDASAITPEVFGDAHVIKLSNTNLCLQPLDRSTGDVIVVLTACVPSLAIQNWLFRLEPTGDYEIVNAGSLKCLYVNGPATGNVELIQGGCNVFGTSTPASNALWKPSRLTGFATLQSRIGHRDSGLCADSFGNAFDGIGLRTFHCSGDPQQVFSVGLE
jgi:hypothetical protein